MANFAAINECDDEYVCVERETPWHICEEAAVTNMHRLEAKEYLNEYRKSKRLKTPIEPVDASKLTSEQRLAYDIVLRHSESDTTKALRMIIHGTAGTGKTFILKALKYKLPDSVILTASTGKAAAIINGTTLHYTLNLPTLYKFELGSVGTALLQERFTQFHDCPEKCYIVIDEVSMIGSGLFHWIDRRARQAFARPDEIFGGASIILVGDFAQLPPVQDKSLFDSNTLHPDQIFGHAHYDLFQTVIMLRQNMRVCKEEQKFMEILLRVRDGTTTFEDHAFFEQRFISNVPKTAEFEKAVHLFHGREPTNARNMKMLYALQKPIMKINAFNTPASARSASSKVAKGLMPQLILAVGADIILTKNIWPEAGLINGAFGKIWDVIYAIDEAPPALPIALLVEIPSFRGKSFIDGVPNIVPIVPVQSKFDIGEEKIECTRTQLPVMLAYALTIHKAQGSTLPLAVVDLGLNEPSSAPGLAFVALSRCKSIKDYIFIDWSPTRLNKIQNHSNFAKRMIELNRLEYLFQRTRYDFNGTPMTDENIVDLTKYLKKVKGNAPSATTVLLSRKRSANDSLASTAKRYKPSTPRNVIPIESITPTPNVSRTPRIVQPVVQRPDDQLPSQNILPLLSTNGTTRKRKMFTGTQMTKRNIVPVEYPNDAVSKVRMRKRKVCTVIPMIDYAPTPIEYASISRISHKRAPPAPLLHPNVIKLRRIIDIAPLRKLIPAVSVRKSTRKRKAIYPLLPTLIPKRPKRYTLL